MITIENSTLNLILTEDSETTIIRKDNCRVLVFGDIVRLTDFEFNIYEFDYSTVSDPSEASAEALGETLNDYLNNSTGGGGIPALPTGKIFIGNDSNDAEDRFMSGDVTISKTGVSTISSSAYRKIAPYQRQAYQNRTQGNNLGMLYCPANNVLYTANLSASRVYCYNATNGELLASIVVAGATALLYLPVKGEVYATVYNTGTISRISTAATPTLLGTITGSGSWGIDLVEYSATKVFIVNSASNTTTVINPTTNAVDATIGTVNLTQSITINLNGASVHNGMLILTGSGGIGMINPATNTLTAAANNLGGLIGAGYKIIYNSAQDLYIYCDFGLNQLVYIAPLAATTFSVSFYTTNLNKVSNIVHDTVNNLYIVGTINLTTTATTFATPVILNFIDTTTRLSIRQVLTSSSVLSAVYQNAFLSAGANGVIYVSGSGSLLTNEIIYA
jgi:YVTN family beta-propeller protein